MSIQESETPAMRKNNEGATTLTDIAKKFFDKCPNSLDKSTEAMVSYLLDNPSLFRSVMRDAIYSICRAAIMSHQRHFRTQVTRDIKRDAASPEKQQIGAAALAHGTKKIILTGAMLFPLPENGGSLGYADGVKLQGAIDFYQNQSKTMVHRGKWLSLIYSTLPVKEGKMVCQQLSNHQIDELYFQAEG